MGKGRIGLTLVPVPRHSGKKRLGPRPVNCICGSVCFYSAVIAIFEWAVIVANGHTAADFIAGIGA